MARPFQTLSTWKPNKRPTKIAIIGNCYKICLVGEGQHGLLEVLVHLKEFGDFLVQLGQVSFCIALDDFMHFFLDGIDVTLLRPITDPLINGIELLAYNFDRPKQELHVHLFGDYEREQKKKALYVLQHFGIQCFEFDELFTDEGNAICIVDVSTQKPICNYIIQKTTKGSTCFLES
jgi:hypothetical protein